ncbi:MAG: histidine kinase dimerization/phospho-acceptor domain-containing protein [Desulfuromonadales bacterium]
MISIVVGTLSVLMVFLAAKVLADPIHHMIAVIRDVRRGRFHRQMEITSRDELGELAMTFNRMTSHLQRNRELEASLAQQGKMASLGVLSSGVAHEINNPLGVILGYAGYLENKLDPEDPNHHFIHEIKRESKRCKKIVQDLLNYARTPQPEFAVTDLNRLLDQIIRFAADHTDMHGVEIVKEFADDLPPLSIDGDQIRQVAINLILNAGSAMAEGGQQLPDGRLALADGHDGHVVGERLDHVLPDEVLTAGHHGHPGGRVDARHPVQPGHRRGQAAVEADHRRRTHLLETPVVRHAAIVPRPRSPVVVLVDHLHVPAVQLAGCGGHAQGPQRGRLASDVGVDVERRVGGNDHAE